MNNIIEFQNNLMIKFNNQYNIFLKNINNKLKLENIDLLNQFNNDFMLLIETIKEINQLINLDHNNPLVIKKINNYKKTNKAIKDILPLLIKETINYG